MQRVIMLILVLLLMGSTGAWGDESGGSDAMPPSPAHAQPWMP
jgi:hypothetical protein